MKVKGSIEVKRFFILAVKEKSYKIILTKKTAH